MHDPSVMHNPFLSSRDRRTDGGGGAPPASWLQLWCLLTSRGPWGGGWCSRVSTVIPQALWSRPHPSGPGLRASCWIPASPCGTLASCCNCSRGARPPGSRSPALRCSHPNHSVPSSLLESGSAAEREGRVSLINIECALLSSWQDTRCVYL